MLFTKVMLVSFLIFWARFTYPRFREDQLQAIAWKYLIPLSLANILASGIFKSNPQMIRKMQDISAGPLRRLAGEDAVRPYFLEDEHYEQAERFPYNISPLAFMEYDETKVYEYVQALGWVRPKDTDPNSTNCLLNSYAIHVHVEQSRFHHNLFPDVVR